MAVSPTCCSNPRPSMRDPKPRPRRLIRRATVGTTATPAFPMSTPRSARPSRSTDPRATTAPVTSPSRTRGGKEAAGATSDEKPAVAESGNTLPAETVTDEAPDSELDPLLLLGLGAQLVPAEDVQPATDAGGETLLSGLPVAQPSIAAAIDQTMEETLSAGLPTLDEASSALPKAVQAQPQNPLVDAQAKAEADDGFASLLAGQSADTPEEPELELATKELLESLEGPKESRSSSSADPAAARLNPLSQAIAQQVQQPQRPALSSWPAGADAAGRLERGSGGSGDVAVQPELEVRRDPARSG